MGTLRLVGNALGEPPRPSGSWSSAATLQRNLCHAARGLLSIGARLAWFGQLSEYLTPASLATHPLAEEAGEAAKPQDARGFGALRALGGAFEPSACEELLHRVVRLRAAAREEAEDRCRRAGRKELLTSLQKC